MYPPVSTSGRATRPGAIADPRQPVPLMERVAPVGTLSACCPHDCPSPVTGSDRAWRSWRPCMTPDSCMR